ncbi:hypothetical protein RHSIM_Rhsim08G0065300 [Rhododendron simsii]|uniref:Uncharacterized protein n=1 Tax=Rhododendron simsii TaxID=118357 RepID=A0A834GLT2_RHOSS|nr:hypothetical protein RHSIM_Rhsim08G0065300 [Rhododendron simsii]
MAPNFETNTNCATTNLFPSIAFFVLASNSIGTIYRAYSRRDYYTVGFIVFEYSAFLLLDLCLTAFHKLPSQSRTNWRRFLQLAIWVLYSAMVFGFSAYFGPLFGDPVCGYSLYVVSVVGSVFLFYVYVIWDGMSGCDECLGDQEKKGTMEPSVSFSAVIRVPELRSLFLIICLLPPIGTIYRAYSHRDYYTVGFVVFEYSAFLLLDLCLTAFHKLPSQNRTNWRRFLQLAIWVLYSAMVFGFSTYFGPLFGDPVCGYSLYVVSIVGSVFLFYVYVISDGMSGCDECLGDQEKKGTREVKVQVYYDSVWEKV